MRLEYAVTCVTGRVRTINEDNYYLNGHWKEREINDSRQEGCARRGAALFAVCDGLGGEGNGDFASYEAVSGLKAYASNFCDVYREYLINENRRMSKLQEESRTGMDCTFAGLYINGKESFAVNLGDSRVYHVSDSKIKQVSEDHSEFAVLLKYGVYKEDDYYDNNARNRLTRSIGSVSAEEVEPYIESVTVSKGDLFLLCSDGLCGSVRNEEILAILAGRNSCQDIADALVEKALDHNSKDNITALIVRII